MSLALTLNSRQKGKLPFQSCFVSGAPKLQRIGPLSVIATLPRFCCFAVFCSAVWCQAQTATGLQTGGGSSTGDYTAVYRDANSCVWQQTVPQGPSGQTVVRSYTETATGLNFMPDSATGQFYRGDERRVPLARPGNSRMQQSRFI